ncbi:MAG: hypothetical protein K6E93_03035 [Bacteroidales bacterium]|nr:hypothetical protein [Bacteroidales bacterium]
MKKIVLTLLTIALVSVNANAQLGNLAGKALKKAAERTVEKTVEKTVDKTVDKASEEASNRITNSLFGTSKTQNQTRSQSYGNQDAGSQPAEVEQTPQGIMSAMPALPSQQDVVNYLGYQRNGQSFKLIASPVTRFQAQIASLTMQASALVANDVAKMETGYTEAVLAKYGYTIESYERLSDAEKEAFATRYANDMLREAGVNYTVDQLENLSDAEREAVSQQVAASMLAKTASSASATYNTPAGRKYTDLLGQFNEVSSSIEKIFDDANAQCEQLWNSQFAAKGASALPSYWAMAVNLQYNALQKAMDLRKLKQLPIAQQVDEAAKALDKEQGSTVSSQCYAALCAMAYLTDAYKIIGIYQPNL